MANFVATLSRVLNRALLANPKTPRLSMPFCTNLSSRNDSDLDESALDRENDAETESASHSGPSQLATPSAPSDDSVKQKGRFNVPLLENGVNPGIYKAILLGQVGQSPFQKMLKNGVKLTTFTLATGGVQNNRRPFQNEEPTEYANRCTVQWHRVCIYPESLGGIAMKQIVPGSTVYVEGSLETKAFIDPISGKLKRVREVAVRRNGRFIILGKPGDAQEATLKSGKGVGYM